MRIDGRGLRVSLLTSRRGRLVSIVRRIHKKHTLSVSKEYGLYCRAPKLQSDDEQHIRRTMRTQCGWTGAVCTCDSSRVVDADRSWPYVAARRVLLRDSCCRSTLAMPLIPLVMATCCIGGRRTPTFQRIENNTWFIGAAIASSRLLMLHADNSHHGNNVPHRRQEDAYSTGTRKQ